jgi:hypothetical protein
MPPLLRIGRGRECYARRDDETWNYAPKHEALSGVVPNAGTHTLRSSDVEDAGHLRKRAKS